MKQLPPRFPLLAVLAAFATTSAPHTLANEFEVRNAAEFAKCVSATATLERLGTDMKFLEGPQWVPANGGFLIFSDIPSNELKKWTRETGISTFRSPSNNTNGNTLDNMGRLVSAEHSARRISITDTDGTIRTVVDEF